MAIVFFCVIAIFFSVVVVVIIVIIIRLDINERIELHSPCQCITSSQRFVQRTRLLLRNFRTRDFDAGVFLDKQVGIDEEPEIEEPEGPEKHGLAAVYLAFSARRFSNARVSSPSPENNTLFASLQSIS